MKIIYFRGLVPIKTVLPTCWRTAFGGARRKPGTVSRSWIQPMRISIPAPAVSAAATKAPALRRTMWRAYAKRSLPPICLVFVTPLYYYGMSAQLKTMIDRFCAFNSSIQRTTHEICAADGGLEQRQLDL